MTFSKEQLQRYVEHDIRCAEVQVLRNEILSTYQAYLHADKPWADEGLKALAIGNLDSVENQGVNMCARFYGLCRALKHLAQEGLDKMENQTAVKLAFQREVLKRAQEGEETSVEETKDQTEDARAEAWKEVSRAVGVFMFREGPDAQPYRLEGLTCIKAVRQIMKRFSPVFPNVSELQKAYKAWVSGQLLIGSERKVPVTKADLWEEVSGLAGIAILCRGASNSFALLRTNNNKGYEQIQLLLNHLPKHLTTELREVFARWEAAPNETLCVAKNLEDDLATKNALWKEVAESVGVYVLADGPEAQSLVSLQKKGTCLGIVKYILATELNNLSERKHTALVGLMGAYAAWMKGSDIPRLKEFDDTREHTSDELWIEASKKFGVLLLNTGPNAMPRPVYLKKDSSQNPFVCMDHCVPVSTKDANKAFEKWARAVKIETARANRWLTNIGHS